MSKQGKKRHDLQRFKVDPALLFYHWGNYKKSLYISSRFLNDANGLKCILLCRWQKLIRIVVFLVQTALMFMGIFLTFFVKEPEYAYPFGWILYRISFGLTFVISAFSEINVKQIHNGFKVAICVAALYGVANGTAFYLATEFGSIEQQDNIFMIRDRTNTREIQEKTYYRLLDYKNRALLGMIFMFYASSFSILQSSPAKKQKFQAPISLTTTPQQLQVSLTEQDWTLRQQAIKRINATSDVTLIYAILESLKDQDGRVRREGIRILHNSLILSQNKHTHSASLLERYPSIKESLFEAFTHALNDDAIIVRKEAAFALGKIPDIRVIPYLFKALNDQYQPVQENAMIALQSVLPLVQIVIFGEDENISEQRPDTLSNPDVIDLTVSMRNLRKIVIHTASYNFYVFERFLTYAVNVIGRDYLKQHVDVLIYGHANTLHPNLKNNVINLFREIKGFSNT